MHSKCCEKGYISGFKNGFKQYLRSGSGSIGSARFWLPGSGSKKKNIKQKLQNKLFYTNPKSKLLKKRDFTNFLTSEWLIKFYIKKSQERRKIIIQFCFVNISKSYNNLHGLDPEPLFFQCGSESASKLKGS